MADAPATETPPEAQKIAWPELMQADADAAVAIIESERPDLAVVVKTQEVSVLLASPQRGHASQYYDAPRQRCAPC